MNRDRQGNPIGTLKWSALLEDDEYRTIEHTKVGDVEVSTVWIGIYPALFETLIYGGDHDRWVRRYGTDAAAVLGHAQIVTALKCGDDPRMEFNAMAMGLFTEEEE